MMTKDKKSPTARQTSGKSQKPAYETPAIVILGELARGSGVCSPGTNPTGSPRVCTVGPAARVTPPPVCARGAFATSTCTRGRRG